MPEDDASKLGRGKCFECGKDVRDCECRHAGRSLKELRDELLKKPGAENRFELPVSSEPGEKTKFLKIDILKAASAIKRIFKGWRKR